MREDNMPVFVKIEDYKEISEILALTKEKLRQIKSLFERLQELKAKEDEQLAKWSKQLEEVESRVADVDKILLSPSQV